LGAFKADPPEFFTEPPGPVEDGIAASVDTYLGLQSNPNVLFVEEFTSEADEKLTWQGWNQTPGYSILHEPEFFFDERSRSWFLRTHSRIGDKGITALHKWIYPKWRTVQPWQVDNQLDTPTELFVSYDVELEKDVGGQTDGFKLPGMSGTFEWNVPPAIDPWPGGWSFRMRAPMESLANPGVFHLWVYAYDADHRIGTGSGWNILTESNFVIATGRRYRIEQHVRLNTQAANGTWNADGLLEVWVNGRKVISKPNYKIRSSIYAGIQDVPFLNIFWGGQTPPDRVMHFQLGNVVASRAYVGLAKCDKTITSTK
jgi:hypothetical protein